MHQRYIVHVERLDAFFRAQLTNEQRVTDVHYQKRVHSNGGGLYGRTYHEVVTGRPERAAQFVSVLSEFTISNYSRK